jgi:hypothetical protein
MAVEILTYLPPIEARQEHKVQSKLATFERGRSPFVEIPGTHVARFVVINSLGTGDPTHRRRLRPARLLFSAVVDGPEEAWLYGLFKKGAALEDVWEHCSGWPAGAPLEARTPWLTQYRRTPTHQIVARNATVAEILRGLELQRVMAELKHLKDTNPADLRAAYKKAMAEVGP